MAKKKDGRWHLRDESLIMLYLIFSVCMVLIVLILVAAGAPDLAVQALGKLLGSPVP